MAPILQLALRLALGGVDKILQPAVPGSLLLLLKFSPEELVDQTLDRLPLRGLERNVLKHWLQILLLLGVVRSANRILNSYALNHWRRSTRKNWVWNKEIAVVTGGSNGIGKAVTLGLVRKGVKVAVLDVHELPTDMMEVEGISFFKCDVTSLSDVIETSKLIQSSIGHPSILINNAGIAQSHTILDASDDFIRKIFALNIVSLWWTTKAFLPSMINADKGHIINVASIASFVALSSAVDYSATKAGVLAFNEGLACELKHVHKARGVMTTVVHPSWTRTNMTSKHADKIESRQGPMMTPEHVANKVLDQIFECRGGQLIIPEQVSLISSIRGWPNWLQELLRDGIGKGRAL